MRVGVVALDLSFKGIDEIEFLIANVGRVKMGLIKCVLSIPFPYILQQSLCTGVIRRQAVVTMSVETVLVSSLCLRIFRRLFRFHLVLF